MDLKLVSLMGVLLHKNVYEVIMPTSEGEIAVFPGHEPVIAVAIPGVVSVRYFKDDADEKMDLFAISGGIIEISQKSVRILVDEADSSDDIIEEEAKLALKRAVEMKEKASSQVELEKAHQLVDRHEVRLKVAELRRRRR